MHRKILHIVCLFLLFTSCKQVNNTSFSNEDGKVIAKVGTRQLMLQKALESLPNKLSSKDSAVFLNTYINNWINQQLLLQKAEENLTDEQKDVESQLEAYRNSLIIYAYEKELINQRLDTSISEEEIEKYYEENPSNFELKENIVKVAYVKVNNKAPNINKVKEWIKLKKENDRKQLESYCYQFAENFFLDDKSWLLFNDLLKEIPIKTYNQEEFLQNNRLIEMQDSLYRYFVNIQGFKIKDSMSPLSFEKENIKAIILNKRKLQLIEQMRKDLYDDALKNNKFEIIEP